MDIRCYFGWCGMVNGYDEQYGIGDENNSPPSHHAHHAVDAARNLGMSDYYNPGTQLAAVRPARFNTLWHAVTLRILAQSYSKDK